MTDEAVVREDAAHVVVALEDDAEKVESLALEPVGAGPDAGQGCNDRRIGLAGKDSQAQPPVACCREKMRDDRKATGRKRAAVVDNARAALDAT